MSNIKPKNKFKIKKLSAKFGEKYSLISPDNSIGILRHYDLDTHFQISILKSKGKTEHVYFSPNKDSNVIGILYCIDGKLFLFSNDNQEQYQVRKNDIIIYKRDNHILNDFHVESEDIENILIFIHMDKMKTDMIKSVEKTIFYEWKEKISRTFDSNNFYYSVPNAQIEILVTKIINTQIKTISDYMLFKQLILNFIFSILDLMLNSENDTSLNNVKFVEDVKKFINEYPVSELPTIKKIAEVFGLSIYQLQNSFMKAENISLFRYMTKLKMEYSRLLLTTTDKSITEIAYEVGYENPSKFSESFKNFFGILPSKFRKSNK